jgi:hypothetical protein
MKKIGIILLMAALFSCNNTQAQITMTAATASLDSILNAGTNTAFKTPSLNSLVSGNYRVVFTAANVSGTSTFKAVLEGSMDGTTWFKLVGNSGTDGRNTDTLQCTSVTTAYQFTMTSIAGGGKYVYSTQFYNDGGRVLFVRVRFIGTGTQVTRISSVKLYSFN